MEFGIYKWTNIVTGRVLVGQTGSTVGFEKRKARYLYCMRKGIWENTHFQRSWDKHGEDKFIFEILERLTEDGPLTQREQYWIELHRRTPAGVYNLTGPSDNPRRGAKCTAEHKQKVAAALRGKKRPSPSAETSARRSASMKGHAVSPETRRKISDALSGIRRGPELRQRLSQLHKKRCSDPAVHASIVKLRRQRGRGIERIHPATGEVFEYKCISDITHEGFFKGAAIQCAQGKRLTHGGFFWRYLERI